MSVVECGSAVALAVRYAFVIFLDPESTRLACSRLSDLYLIFLPWGTARFGHFSDKQLAFESLLVLPFLLNALNSRLGDSIGRREVANGLGHLVQLLLQG